MRVSVAFAEQRSQFWQEIEVDDTCTVEEAVRRSGVLERFPDIDLEVLKVGIFGKPARIDAALSAGDRVEIYRPIIADPETVPRRDLDE